MSWAVALRIAAAVVVVTSLATAAAQARRWAAIGAYDHHALPVCRVDGVSDLVALSFDDGPTPGFTLQILRRLEAARVRATFFVVGAHVVADPEAVRAELAGSMELGDHTWSHPHLPELSLSELREQIDRTDAAVASIATERPTLFRAPFGEIGADGLDLVAADGLRAIGWSLAVDPYLHGTADPATTARTIANDVRPGDIVLAHDGGADRSTTVALLAPLLRELGDRGYRVVPVGELLEAGRPIRAEPRPWFWQSGFACPRSPR